MQCSCGDSRPRLSDSAELRRPELRSRRCLRNPVELRSTGRARAPVPTRALLQRCPAPPPPAAAPAYAAHRATHPHPAHLAKLQLAPARSPLDPAFPLPPELTPAACGASRRRAPAALPVERRRETHTDSHSESRARIATAPAYPPQPLESFRTPCRAAGPSVPPRPSLR